MPPRIDLPSHIFTLLVDSFIFAIIETIAAMVLCAVSDQASTPSNFMLSDKPSPPSFLRWGRVRSGRSLSQERQLVCDMWRTEIRDPPSPARYKVGGGQRGARQFPRLRESKVSDI
ncbi:predicted protein [Histoplasma capsulatum H143]|uniref:Uncharacterized protein n=1 Tax=Ajellomyces capsulatus (strain H143) TaxID=544712 RepID=C6HGY4_AJECH|nr:predicted protein [Histoplasma capsulatum H143]